MKLLQSTSSQFVRGASPKFGCSYDGMMHFSGKAQKPLLHPKFGCSSDGMAHFAGKETLNVKA